MALEFKDSADEQAANIPVGETFTISLRENPTTGYLWKTMINGDPICTIRETNFDAGSRPGAEGVHHWHFVAARPGSTRIEMILDRPGSHSEPPTRTFTLKVLVKDK